MSTFEVKDCDSLDAMNFLNIMTEDEFYIRHHLTEYEHFKHLSREKKFKSLINESISINGNTMLSPYLTLVISSVPNFDCMDVKTLLGDKNLLKSFFSNTIYFNLDSWEKREKLFDNTLELITILESHYFFEYWRENKKALIIEKCLEMSKYISKYNVFDEINNMLGPQSKIENITLYLCSFASPHGIKLADTSYISDISYPLETTLGIAIHEMFHPPYKIKE